MKNTTNQIKINKEIKGHKSAQIPPDSTTLNNSLFKDNSDNGSNSNNTNSTTCEGMFKLKSNSLFAYQEFDKFSSFCDNESNNDSLHMSQNDKKIINNINNYLNDKDDLNNTMSSFSLNEFIEDYHINNSAKKRKSACDPMPPYFAQYLSKNYLNGESIFENSDNNFFNNIMNNQFSFEIKRTNTEKQNKNFINALFNQLNNMKKNQEPIFNFENKKKPQGFVPIYNNLENRRKSQGVVPIYNYNAFNQNFGAVNNFNNMLYLNKAFNGGERPPDIQAEKQICQNDNIKMGNKNEKKDIPNVINEFPENFRKKSNSLALKANPVFNQINQIKNNYPYSSNKKNIFLNSNNLKDKKFLNNYNYNNNHSVFFIFQDQSNCRNIQEQLELHKNDVKYIQNFLEEIKPDLISIVEHQFGNYVIQKLLEILIHQENRQLFKEFALTINKNDKLYEISVNNYGTRVIQKTLEKLIDNNFYSKIETPELNNCINDLIKKHLYDLCCDKNGNHVYQKLLKVFHNEKNNDFLYEYLSPISLDVALLQQGATIFTTAFNFSNLKQKEKISKNIIENIDKLINNKYGNYSIQAIINKLENEKNLIEPIYLYISENLLELSKQKYSSNVIDTFIMKRDDYSKKLVDYMINKDLIKDIIKDQYGNYVVQKAMNISDKETKNKIIKQIKPIVPELLESNLGKKIYEKLSQQYNDVFNNE